MNPTCSMDSINASDFQAPRSMRGPHPWSKLWSALMAAATLAGIGPAAEAQAVPQQPRIVNLYNFIRNSDYRLANSEEVLFEATRKQLELIRPTKLPTTWALQYDALMNPRYQKLLKEQAGPHDEIAAWWEIPRPLARKAGLTWRGHNHEWDSTANVGFSPGYAPAERRKLVDVYMADFKEIFGHYPRSVGSWFIDEVTLAHMVDQYGIVASCNCKDQIGTDGYTLWGGYWNQAYYPSRVNAYMPAQTKDGQLDVPIFRMLGSDPIYQYGTGHGISSMEPVYGGSGGSPKWVGWFMRNMIEQPALAFAYTQAGQENSFGWNSMKNGLTMQVKLLSEQSKAGKIQVMTLAEAGQWFQAKYPLTPPTAVTCLDDWKDEGRKSVWYNSRFFRANMLWEGERLVIRDIHRFDEKIVSVTHDAPLTTRHLAYLALPVMDGAHWSGPGRAGMQPVLLAADGSTTAMTLDGPPVVKELNETDLRIDQPLLDGARLSVICREKSLAFSGEDAEGRPLRWAWELRGGDRMQAAVASVTEHAVSFRGGQGGYQATTPRGMGSCRQLEAGRIRLTPNARGRLVLSLGSD